MSHNIDCCSDPTETAKIITCLCELKQTIACVLNCLNTDCSSQSLKERIILCILLEEIRKIEAKLDNPKFGLNEIKNEIIAINEVVIDINNLLTNNVFGLNEIKNEVREIENGVSRVIRILNNREFGLNEIKNEVKAIEGAVFDPAFGLNEINNEIIDINHLLTNEEFGLNEIKNEIRALNHPLTCATDSILVCGESVSGNMPLHILADTNGIISTLPSASAYNQIGRLYAASFRHGSDDTKSYYYIKIVNPIGKRNRVLYLERISGGTMLFPANSALSYESSVDLLLMRDSVFDEKGYKIVPKNQNFGFSNDSDMEVESLQSDIIYGFLQDIWDTTQVSGLFTIEFHGQIIVPPGHSLMLCVQGHVKNSTLTQGGLITIVWYEL